jgi:DNA polymerase-3 subunit gamma/tau
MPFLMAYVALYRKYRSQSFGEVIGQEHVTTVLQNALRMGRIAHAYLFCGPRGCGKTSTARLLARALNCQAGDGPTPEPCGACEMCLRIRDGSAIDVTEMDAASETGIDDVREKIIENAKYAPAEARYRVYIIDEVHDLSLKAFDSLLKTIEEPPAHVVFVLATTEVHKVPLTIRSRCQRMDFRRATLDDLICLLKRVLEAEGISYEVESLSALARAAEGSFRDSLSLLEQALAYTDGRLTAEAVHASVGTVGPQMLDEVIRTIAQDDLRAAYLKAADLVESGKDVKQTLIVLQNHLRDLLVAGIAAGPQALADVSPERFKQLKEQSGWFAPAQLLRMLDVLADAERELRFSNQHRLILERALWTVLPSALTPRPPLPRTGEGERGVRAGDGDRPPATERAARMEPLTPPTPPPAKAEGEKGKEVEKKPEPPSTPPPTPSDSGARFADAIDLDGIWRVWPRVVRRITQLSRAATAIFTDDVCVLRLEGRFVVLGFPDEFKRSRADKPKGREVVEQSLAAELGIEGLKVRCVLSDEPPEPGASPADEPAPLDFPPEPPAPGPKRNGGPPPPPPDADAPDSPPERTKPPASQEDDGEFLTLVMDEFDGRLVDG